MRTCIYCKKTFRIRPTFQLSKGDICIVCAFKERKDPNFKQMVEEEYMMRNDNMIEAAKDIIGKDKLKSKVNKILGNSKRMKKINEQAAKISGKEEDKDLKEKINELLDK